MAEVKLISECFVKPKNEVEAAKQPYHLSPVEVGMLSIHPIQKGLLFTLDNQPYSSDRTKLVSHLMTNLKTSLSIVLHHFYILAGRFATQKYPDEHACSIYVDCLKGPGARLLHAELSHFTISDIVSPNDIPVIVNSFFDLGEKWINYDGHTKALVSVQVTELTDGLFMGFTMNHSVADGTSFIHFVSMLSEVYRSQDNNDNTRTKISRVPIFDYKPWAANDDRLKVIKLPSLEPEELVERQFDLGGQLRERIFHFSPKAVATLKDKANQECGEAHGVTVSSYQALSAFVWRSIIRARNLPSDQLTTCSMLMNVRKRFDPSSTDDYFGNFIGLANGNCNVGELLSNDLGWAAMTLRNAIMGQNREAIVAFFKMFAEFPKVIKPGTKEELHGSNEVIIGGSARFDMYGPEFGLGRAVATRMGFGNKEDGKVTANPGCEGGGSVDLEICLKPHFMAALEADSEFMSIVSLC